MPGTIRRSPFVALALLGGLVAACAELEVPETSVGTTVLSGASPSPSASVRASQRPSALPKPPEPVLQPVSTPVPATTPTGAAVTVVATPKPRPTPSAPVCTEGRALQVLPSNTGPGGLIYLAGTGFTSATKVMLGTRPLTVEQRSATQLAARLPASFPVSETPQEVKIVGCEAVTVGQVTVNLPAVTGSVPGQGLLAQRFTLPPTTRGFPADDQQRFGVQSFIAGTVDTPRRAATTGESFGVSLYGRLIVPIAGITQFRTLADDGMRLLIDGQLIIDESTSGSFVQRTALVTLTAGFHEFRLDYFQATPPELGLDVFWTLPNSLEGRIPPEAFVMPVNPFHPRP